MAEGPLLAGMRVVTASGGGKIRESLAMAKTYAGAREQQGDSELLDELVAAPPAMEPGRTGKDSDIGALAQDRLREAVQLLEPKASPEEVEAYKRFTLSVAQAAANAHKEGGFLGIGGKQVSDTEQAALDEIAATLGVTPA